MTVDTLPVWPHLSLVADRYDLVICDLWGVMHDGRCLNPGAVAAMQGLAGRGIARVFLTNAPRPRYEVRDMLVKMGLPAADIGRLVTSGGLARDRVRDAYTGRRLYHMGPRGDRETIAGLPVQEVGHIDDADIILCTHLDLEEVEDHRAYMKNAAARGVPFLCANPDRVVNYGLELHPCAGAVADIYESLGGPVEWFGKPMASAVDACIQEAGLPPSTSRERILLIGDSLRTDIAAADAADIDSLLVLDGIHADQAHLVSKAGDGKSISLEAFSAALANPPVRPTAVTSMLNW